VSPLESPDQPAQGAGRDRARKVPLLLLLLLVLVSAGGSWGSVLRDYVSEDNDMIGRPNYDFFVYWVAGRDWRLGLDPYVSHPEQGELNYATGTGGKLDRYLYPPTMLPIYGALTRLSYDTARFVWLALNLATFGAAIAIAALLARKRWLEVVTASVLLAVASFGFLYCLRQGQIDLFVSSVAIIGFLLYGKARSWPTAALLAVATLTKVMPVLILLAMVAYYRDLALLGKTIVCLAAGVLLSLAFVDIGMYPHYIASVLPVATIPDPYAINLSPLRFLADAPAVAKAISLIGWALLAVVCYDGGARSRALSLEDRWVPIETERYAILLLSVAFSLFFAPLLWVMGTVWLIIPVALVVTAPSPRGRPWAALVVGVGVVLALVAPGIGLLATMVNLTPVGLAMIAAALVLLYLPFRRAVHGPAAR
jgi:hypothetical protein